MQKARKIKAFRNVLWSSNPILSAQNVVVKIAGSLENTGEMEACIAALQNSKTQNIQAIFKAFLNVLRAQESLVL